jgi:CRP/FNR family cyclic AMP-dependent transcriptional regulator
MARQCSGTKRQQAAPSITELDLIDSVGDGTIETTFGLKDTLFHQGDPANSVYFLRKGSVQIVIVSEHGKEGVIAVLGSGSFLGEGCLAGQPLRMASAFSTSEETLAVRIAKSAMVRALNEQTEFGELFSRHLLSRNVQIEAELVDHLFNSSEKRLARTLLMLASFGKDGAMETTIPMMTQDTLAARVGTTRSRVNVFMNKFRTLGYVEYDSSEIKVHSSLLKVI